MHCGRAFEGNNAKFCSQACKDSHIAALEKRVRQAVDDDPSHTKRMSDD
ncbi:MAG: hypothetical protein J4F36_03765 [Nitrosopumilaceae archaeon]|nr:hypothetical protein [Nitrosopumilaceae archaeon]